MTSVADGIGIRSHGIAGATLATLDLARARIFSLVRLGFPPFVDEADKFALAREPALSRCASRPGMKGHRSHVPRSRESHSGVRATRGSASRQR
jgi:hypothetical protein